MGRFLFPLLSSPDGGTMSVPLFASCLSLLFAGCESPATTASEDPDAETVLAEIMVIPEEASLEPGDEVPFRAEGRDARGRPVPVSASWTAEGGAITGEGLFTAGETPGDYRITATDADVIGRARARIEAPPAPPTTLVDECAAPEESWIWCDDFESNRMESYFEFNEHGESFGRDDEAGLDGSSGMRTRFDEGQVSAGWLHLAFGKTPQDYFRPVDEGTALYRDIYWRIYLKNEASWAGGGGYKLSRGISFASDSTWAQAMAAHVWSGNRDTSGENHLYLDPASGTDEEGNLRSRYWNDSENWRWLGSRRGDTPIFDESHVGDWHCIEVHVRLNDPGLSNGVFELWIDGWSEARRDDLNWVGRYDEYGINAVFLENYWNGGSPRTQERYFDNFVVSTERIGC